MNISATVKSKQYLHQAIVQTNANIKTIEILPKISGFGSSVSGGELLVLALATCICNDIYREAAKRNIIVSEVDVECHAVFGVEGEPGKQFQYRTNIVSSATAEEINELIGYVDSIAEIHNTLRNGVSVTLIR